MHYRFWGLLDSCLAADAFQRLAALHFLVIQFFAVMRQFERQFIRRVVFQHVEYKPFLNRLAHRINMKRRGQIVGARG